VSLRARVALLILAMFVAGMLVVMARTRQDARHKIEIELQANQLLATQMTEMVFGRWTGGPQQPLTSAQLGSLARLDEIRRFDVVAAAAESAYPQFTVKTAIPPAVPGWFVGMLAISEDLLVQQVGTYGGDRVLIRIDPSDELVEIWDNANATVTSLLGLLLLLNIVIYLMLGRWLHPIDQTIAGLHEIEKGDFGHLIPATGLPELDLINNKINQLTKVLDASKQDNERLQAEAISNQEQERLRLARELHDSLGQSISAIKAMAVSIAIRTRDKMADIAESARQIELTSEAAYGSVRNLMAWLRPAALDLGLATALQQMIDDWNVHHDNTFCRLNMQSRLDGLADQQAINVYRIVQESLTNIAKHAAASRVDIDVHGESTISLAIVDNGKGFSVEKIRKGMGLWNIQDRVNLLQGKIKLVASPGNGLSLYIEFPRHPVRRSEPDPERDPKQRNPQP